ncbi:sulfotransferase 2B1-like [Hyla sarda]|uniref:sulfotransferase 2B1-like n=1 Tax=Hyla sarda TaxID=327740 RepID=UPI0024C2C45F|nr:sulfotransferase 2B1-like [Hyla sarda]XP_056399478.1 sulfotransferase 2B1-like [Hyla sarda]XP_056399479.1 sulfotransferase 2B1-like [Hyla sarda]
MSVSYVQYNGILFPQMSISEDFASVENEFQVRDDDIFNVTYPKSGTTWMIDILSLIQKNGDPTWTKTVPNWDRAPWIETPGSVEKLNLSKQCPRLITSHLPIHMFMKSFEGSKAKVIYTIRNPKDIAVSLYYFAKMSAFYREPESMDTFIKYFLSKDVLYGSWFNHIKGWLELQGKDNFMFQTYEDLKLDLRGSVVKLCKFLGKELKDKEVDSVVENVSFNNMKENTMSNFTLLPAGYMDHEKSPFMRKGIVGDWKNHFTVAQNEYFDKIYKMNMQDFSVKFPWDTNTH